MYKSRGDVRASYEHLKARSDFLVGYVLNGPAMLVVFGLVVYPIGYSFWVSMHKYNLRRPNVFTFVGFGNYLDALKTELFWKAFRVTTIFTSLSVFSVIVVGMVIALVANESFKGRGLIRGLILLPWAIPPVVNGLMWQWIYDSKVGALNGLLAGMGLISEYRGWLSDPVSALLALVWADVWNMMPLAVILLLAALQRIPAELYDAARVDGGGALQHFRYITLPWLAQPLLIVLILQTMSAIRAFDIIYVLTAGGPGTATTTLSWKTYLTTFDSLDFGMGNAYAYTISLMTFALALVYFRVLYRKGEFEA